MVDNDKTIIESSAFITNGTPVWDSGENTKSLTLGSSISKAKLSNFVPVTSVISLERDSLMYSIDSLENIISSIKSKSSFISAKDSELTKSFIIESLISSNVITSTWLNSVIFKIWNVSSSSIILLISLRFIFSKAIPNSTGKISASKYSKSPPTSFDTISSL